jgi:hypothetical protein
MANKKQTAVDYFFYKMIEYLHNAESEGIYEVGTQNTKRWLEIFLDETKAMEKEQIMDAFGIGCQVEATRLIGYHGMAEQYYKETYG